MYILPYISGENLGVFINKNWIFPLTTSIYNWSTSGFVLYRDQKTSVSSILLEPICGSYPKYLIGRVFLGSILFCEKDYSESTELTVQRKPKP